MSEQPYNNRMIAQYLLGSLPVAETERFDELGFTDDEFAEALGVAEKDLVDAYVQGELTGADLEQFKSYYLASPLRREKVEFAQAFQSLAEKDMEAQAAESHGKFAMKRKGSGWFSALSVFMAPRPALQWATAFAAVALLIAGGWLVFENTRLRQQVSQTQARRDALAEREQKLQKQLEEQRTANATTGQELARVREERERLEQDIKKEQEAQRAAGQQRQLSSGGVNIASFILAPQVRSTGAIQTVNVPADINSVAMELPLEPNSYSAYQVALIDQSTNHILWRGSRLMAKRAGQGKSITASFRAGVLKAQAVYILRVSGVSANGVSETVGDYLFRVVK